MKKKGIFIFLLIITVCFFILGFCLKKNAEEFKGVQATFGINVDGEFREADSGRIGGNRQQYDKLNMRGTMCYVVGGITSTLTVIVFVKNVKRKSS